MTDGFKVRADNYKCSSAAGDACSCGHRVDCSCSRPYDVVRGQIPADLLTQLVCPYSENCRHELFRRCGLTGAKGVLTPHRPKALWIFGPPAVGKSSIADKISAELFGAPGNAVLVDGDDMRLAHAGFQQVAEHGFRNRVVHADAWEKFKKAKLTEKLKKEVMRTAMEQRQNLLIPDAGVCLERCREMLEELVNAGYDLHAVCMWAPEAQTWARGTARAATSGKVFNPQVYWPAIHGALEMGRHWHSMMQAGSDCYKAVTFYDNSGRQCCRVGLVHFEFLTLMAQSKFQGATCQAPDRDECLQPELCHTSTPIGGVPGQTRCSDVARQPKCGDAARQLARVNSRGSSCSQSWPVTVSVQ